MTSLSKPCAICEKHLESVWEDWHNLQPDGGCELQIIASFGSKKFDHHIHSTCFSGVVCDECVERIMPRLNPLK